MIAMNNKTRRKTSEKYITRRISSPTPLCYTEEQFIRSVEFPTNVQADKVKAPFENGVIEIRLPKSEEVKTKQIKVNIE
jgi:HSP20 family molecular chaperone IbpA